MAATDNSNLGPPPIATPALDDSPDESGIPFQFRAAQTGNPSGRIFSTSWLQWFNKVYVSLGSLSPVNPGGGGSLNGGSSVKTANYTAVSADSGLTIVFNSATAVTLTLPSPTPNSRWNIIAENIGAGELTINRNGLTIDGLASNLTVARYQSSYITVQGANYIAPRGGPIPGTSITDSVAAVTLQLASTKVGATTLQVDGPPTTSGVGIAVSGKTYAISATGGTGAGSSTILASATNSICIQASATTGEAGDFTNNSSANAALRLQNSGTAFDLSLGKLQFNGGPALPTGVAASDGAEFYWTVGKNFLDDGAVVGSIAVTGGAGVKVFHVNGSWRTLC